MKKNLFKSLLTMCALGAMFTACSNEGNEVPDVTKGEKKTVFMKLNLGTSENGTRATEDPINTATVATVNNLHIYFYKDADKSIQKYMKVTSSTTPSISDLETGKEIADVPAAADKILIRGNVPASVTLPVGGLITVVENQQINITTQKDNADLLLGHLAAPIQNWNGVGGAPITGMTSAGKYAVVELELSVARIEVEGLKATGQVNAFKLKGIYVNNFYKNLKLGDGASADKENYGATASNYALGQGLYQAANTKLFDEFTPGSATGETEAASGKRWAYHAFSNDAVIANDQLQLIFKVSDLAGGGGVTFPAGDQFITVRGFKDKITDQIVKLEKGKIYSISKSDFTFDESNLSTVPNTDAVGVWLKVTVKPWTVVAVKPNL
ncbi:hypothetical protein M1B74_10610 [Bacteroides pyogenes]|uniref:hypothetical protein n=1 Tax=Bacteroides pyogenes TaxID=310300 RepID=UPI003B4362EB